MKENSLARGHRGRNKSEDRKEESKQGVTHILKSAEGGQVRT